jgi:hypothetical protein
MAGSGTVATGTAFCHLEMGFLLLQLGYVLVYNSTSGEHLDYQPWLHAERPCNAYHVTSATSDRVRHCCGGPETSSRRQDCPLEQRFDLSGIVHKIPVGYGVLSSKLQGGIHRDVPFHPSPVGVRYSASPDWHLIYATGDVEMVNSQLFQFWYQALHIFERDSSFND